MRRTGEAWVEHPDACLDAIQYARRDTVAVEKMFSDLVDSSVHRMAILAGGDQHVHFLEYAILIHPIAVEERPPRCLACHDPFGPVDHCLGPDVGPEDRRVVQDSLDFFDGKQQWLSCLSEFAGSASKPRRKSGEER